MHQVQMPLQRVSLEAGAGIRGSGKVVGIGLNGQIHYCLAPANAGCKFLNPELATYLLLVSVVLPRNVLEVVKLP